MTEEEARNKVCKIISVHDQSGNFVRDDYIYCIASDCMMWRWEEDRTYSGRQEGYCGLGGKQ